MLVETYDVQNAIGYSTPYQKMSELVALTA